MFLILIIKFILSFNFGFHQIPTNEIHCIKELQPTLNTLGKLPEVQEIVKNILKEGPITIRYNDRYSNAFMGYWNPYDRTISITKCAKSTTNDQIVTMLFEMHNAKRTKDFKKLDQLASNRQLTEEQYVRQSELIEYENCLSTSKLLQKGGQLGIFSTKITLAVHDNFEDHYIWMKQSGHAAWYASTYKRMHQLY